MRAANSAANWHIFKPLIFLLACPSMTNLFCSNGTNLNKMGHLVVFWENLHENITNIEMVKYVCGEIFSN